tara:strand:+ start:2263 stop:2523 length:261 start_codon:yes stop_codon:yes gene_type:complete
MLDDALALCKVYHQMLCLQTYQSQDVVQIGGFQKWVNNISYKKSKRSSWEGSKNHIPVNIHACPSLENSNLELAAVSAATLPTKVG